MAAKPERPLLLLPPAGKASKRQKRKGYGGKFHYPSPEEQSEKLGGKFRELEQVFEEKRIQLQAEASGFVPEDVVVMEVINSINNFVSAVRKIPGMEWLGDLEVENISPDDDMSNQSRNVCFWGRGESGSWGRSRA